MGDGYRNDCRVSTLHRNNKGLYTTMDHEEKLQLLQDVLDIDWAQTDASVSDDIVRLTRGILNDMQYTWYDDDVFINILLDEFADDHPVWAYIILD